MAWYHGTFACGCEGRVNVIGPNKNRQYIIDKKFENLCPDCYEKKIQEENLKAEEASKEMELPELEGSSKQIAWATTIRLDILNKISKVDFSSSAVTGYVDLVTGEKDYLENRIEELTNYMIEEKLNSSYYIDNREAAYSTERLTALFIYLSREIITHEEEKIVEIKAKNLLAKNTIEPEDLTHDGVVEIVNEENIIKAYFVKNDNFIEIMRKARFSWKSGCWQRKINKFAGTLEDRMAEIGNKLLNEGFRICIHNDVIKENAITGTYENEPMRWIRVHKDNIQIFWKGRDEKLYKLARKIPTAKYNSSFSTSSSCCIDIKLNGYDGLIEFARLYDFKYDEESKSIIEQYLLDKKSIKKVTPSKVEEVEYTDGLEDILNSDDEIIQDLLDE